jgi:PEP-CTERM motif
MRMRNTVGGLALFLAGTAGAQQTQIDMLAHMNDQLTSQYCCDANLYPTSGFLTNLGVTFSMASNPDPFGGAPIDAWRGENAVNRTFNLAIGMSGITSVYTIMDTRFGYAGDPTDPSTAQASLTFNYLSSASVTQYLYGCFNTRDHNPGGYSAGCWPLNAPAPAGSNAQQFASFGNNVPVVFDMQTWDVSANASDQLTSITFTDYGPGVNTPFLRAVTVDARVVATPEPATLALMATGLLGIGGVARRKRA